MTKLQLLQTAESAAEKAYAPYSKFCVGAALLCADGSVVTGCNVENGSFGLSNCAERTAVFSAIAHGKREFSAIAIVTTGQAVPLPCGACRQVLAEFCRADFKIYVARSSDLANGSDFSLNDLLPHTFQFQTPELP
jgi:cytidine deaminase